MQWGMSRLSPPVDNSSLSTGCSENILPHLCGYFEEDLRSVFLFFKQLHTIAFRLKFETLFMQWDKCLQIYGAGRQTCGCVRNDTLFVLQNFQNYVYFERKSSSVIFEVCIYLKMA